MAALVWDEVGSRTYETGVDRGVLYLPEGGAVPWNGLAEVVEKHDGESTPVYFDGSKINDLIAVGSFLGTVKAITYPDEMTELEGMAKVTDGIFLGHQRPKLFGLCWRTRVANDLEEDAGYKLHLLYNVGAVPSDKTYSTVADSPSPADFEWNITAVPEEAPGFKPTAYVVLDSRAVNPDLLAEYEHILYGSESTIPAMIPLIDFVNSLYYGYKWKIIDNGDGTFTAITPIEGLLEEGLTEGEWILNDVNVTYWTDDLYTMRDQLV
jgi:hypothetical protein